MLTPKFIAVKDKRTRSFQIKIPHDLTDSRALGIRAVILFNRRLGLFWSVCLDAFVLVGVHRWVDGSNRSARVVEVEVVV